MRREFFAAHSAEPAGAAQALEMIRARYAIEERIRTDKLAGQSKRGYRHDHAKPIVMHFFDWIDGQFEQQGLLPKNWSTYCSVAASIPHHASVS